MTELKEAWGDLLDAFREESTRNEIAYAERAGKKVRCRF